MEFCSKESESCSYYPVPVRCFASDLLTHCSIRLPTAGCPAWSRPFEHTDPGRANCETQNKLDAIRQEKKN